MNVIVILIGDALEFARLSFYCQVYVKLIDFQQLKQILLSPVKHFRKDVISTLTVLLHVA